MNTDNLSRDDWILGGVTVALIITLLFLPWFSVTVPPFTVTATATSSPDGWCGVLALLASIALLVDLGLERVSPQTQVPSFNGSRAQTRLVLAYITAFFVALKFLLHIHFDLFGWGFWLAVVLTVALVYLAYHAHKVETVGGSRRF